MTTNSIRVLHVVPLTPAMVAPPFVERQIASLAGSGIESITVGIRGSKVHRRPLSVYREVRRLRDAVKAGAPDLVHAHWGSLLGFSAALAAGGLPFVVTFRGSDVNPVDGERIAERQLRFALSRGAAIRASTSVAVSDPIAARLPGRRARVRVIPDGVDLDIFTPMDRQLARRELGWDATVPVLFLYQGGRPEAKGRPLADSTIHQLQATGERCRLEVVDSGMTRDEVALRINASDCVLMLSTHEGSPNIVREAIACGTPVVGVAVGDVAKWIERLPGSHLVTRDPLAVAAAVRAVLRSPREPKRQIDCWPFSEGASREALLLAYGGALNPR